MPAAIGGSVSGNVMRLSATSARNDASGACWHGVKLPVLPRATLPISERPATERQIRSGSSPMIE